MHSHQEPHPQKCKFAPCNSTMQLKIKLLIWKWHTIELFKKPSNILHSNDSKFESAIAIKWNTIKILLCECVCGKEVAIWKRAFGEKRKKRKIQLKFNHFYALSENFKFTFVKTFSVYRFIRIEVLPSYSHTHKHTRS